MVLLAAALAPVLAIALFIYWKDSHEREPVRLLWRAFYLGMLGVIPTLLLSFALKPLGLDEKSDSLTFSFISIFLGIAVVEELSKYFGVRWIIYRNAAFNEPLDGIVYSVMAALGFAAVENVLYVLEGGLGVAVARAIFAVPGHAIDGVFIGYFLGLQKHLGRKGYEFIGLALASTFHAFYDFFLMNAEKRPVLLVYFFLMFGLAVRYAIRAIHLHRDASPFRGSARS